VQRKNKIMLSALAVVASASIINAANMTISDGEAPVLTVNGNTLTNQDLYDNLSVTNGFSSALGALDLKVLEEKYADDPRLEGEINRLYDSRATQAENANQSMEDVYRLFGATNREDFIQRGGIRLSALRRLAAFDQAGQSIFTNREINYVYDHMFSGTGEIFRILISPDVSATNAANVEAINSAMQTSLQEAQDIIGRINRGELTFEDAVAQYSADKTNNGSIGTFDINSAREAGISNLVANQVFALGNEQVTPQPILTQFGYEIYMIRYTDEKPTLDEIRGQVNQRLFQIYESNNPFIQAYALDLFRSANNVNFNDTEFARMNANQVIQNRLSFLQFNPNSPNFGF